MTRLVLVQVCVRNPLVLRLCSLSVEPCMMVGLCPMHCSFNLFILKHICVLNSAQGVQQKFPNNLASEVWLLHTATRLEPEGTPNMVPPQEVRCLHLKILLTCGPLPYCVCCLAITLAVNKIYVALVSAYNIKIRGKIKGMNIWYFVNWILVSFVFWTLRMFETAARSDHSLEQFL